MGHRSVPAPFLTKTYSLVEDGESDDVVSWNECGTAFVIWKTADFANDLLPSYFKHSNFSSFVRQLNTYGFRKTVPDKWEFANENFKRGQKDLLIHIHRRKNAPTAAKTAPAVDAGRVADNTTSAAYYGEDLGSTSSKSPSSTDTQASAQLADLSGENEKLKRHNQILSCELARSKRQCNGLIAFLTRCVTVAPEQIGRIMNLESNASCATSRAELADGGVNSDCGDGDESDNCVKLFGVVVKKKRESDEFSGPQKKEMKTGQQDL